MIERLWKVVGAHTLNGVHPGGVFRAALEEGHAWIVGGHVAPAAEKPEPADPAPAEAAPVEQPAADGN